MRPCPRGPRSGSCATNRRPGRLAVCPPRRPRSPAHPPHDAIGVSATPRIAMSGDMGTVWLDGLPRRGKNAHGRVMEYVSLVDQSEVIELDAPRRRERPKCGAKAKQTGRSCQAPAMSNGRCKLHGGMSTGARSLPGKIRCLSGLWQYADCRRDMVALAKEIEKGGTATIRPARSPENF